jgi:hypothetical protein
LDEQAAAQHRVALQSQNAVEMQPYPLAFRKGQSEGF